MALTGRLPVESTENKPANTDRPPSSTNRLWANGNCRTMDDKANMARLRTRRELSVDSTLSITCNDPFSKATIWTLGLLPTANAYTVWSMRRLDNTVTYSIEQ